MIEEALVDCIKSVHGHSRIYPAGSPQGGITPYLSYQLISAPSERVQGDGRVKNHRFQINHFGNTRKQSAQSAAITESALEGLTGELYDDTDVYIMLCSVDDERDDYEFDTKLHNRSIDVVISVEIVNEGLVS